MLLKEETKNIQSQLSGYCRDGKIMPIQGASENRLPTYRRLVFNVIRDTLSQAYPISYEVLDREEWGNLVYEFFKEHNCQNHEVWKMPYELVEYVEATEYHIKLGKPYLLELLYFEWLEIEIHGHEDQEIEPFIPFTGDMSQTLVINPYIKIVQLEYPVHKLSHKELEANKGNYFIMIYRAVETDKVHFSELSNFSAHLISSLISNNQRVDQMLDNIAEKSNIEKEALYSAARDFLNQMQEKGVVLGQR